MKERGEDKSRQLRNIPDRVPDPVHKNPAHDRARTRRIVQCEGENMLQPTARSDTIFDIEDLDLVNCELMRSRKTLILRVVEK